MHDEAKIGDRALVINPKSLAFNQVVGVLSNPYIGDYYDQTGKLTKGKRINIVDVPLPDAMIKFGCKTFVIETRYLVPLRDFPDEAPLAASKSDHRPRQRPAKAVRHL